MYQVLIADDEARIRQGIKKIVNWAELGYSISGEAANGEDAYRFIELHQPDVVLMDIRMPKLTGIDVIKKAKEKGYNGKIIILSGYSDFSYAQQAIHLGVEHYLTKPINESELEDILVNIRHKLQGEEKRNRTNNHLFMRAKESVLKDFLVNPVHLDVLDLENMPAADGYQVVLCEKYNQDSLYPSRSLAKLIRLSESDYECTLLDQNEVFLLIGTKAIRRLAEIAQRLRQGQHVYNRVFLDAMFFTCGREVQVISDVHLSYDDARYLQSRRFFCEQEQHMLSYDQLTETRSNLVQLDDCLLHQYRDTFVDSLAAFSSNRIAEALHQIEELFHSGGHEVDAIKYFLIDLYLTIKESMTRRYSDTTFPFSTNSWAVEFLISRKYLYEIILFLSEQFDMMMSCLGNYSRDSVLDDVVYYIHHHYMSNLKMENIAPLFGYNCSYLGKIFKKKLGMSFNVYLDDVRTNKAKELLQNEQIKVYEIAQRVGYSNADYFYLKFKKMTGCSPAEYRKQCKDLQAND